MSQPLQEVHLQGDRYAGRILSHSAGSDPISTSSNLSTCQLVMPCSDPKLPSLAHHILANSKNHFYSRKVKNVQMEYKSMISCFG
jgi:hypothetical protein